MAFFDKLKSAVGIGQPELKIKITKTDFHVEEEIRGQLVLTVKDRAVKVKELVVYILHSYEEDDDDLKRNEKVHKVVIDTEDIEVPKNGTLERDFCIQLNDTIELTDYSTIIVKAYADIPGLDAKDSIEITLDEDVPAPNQTASLSEDIDWKQKLVDLKTRLENFPGVQVNTFNIGEPSSDTSLQLHPDVQHFFTQVNGLYVDAYYTLGEEEFVFSAFIPSLEEIERTTEEQRQYQESLNDKYIFSSNDEALSYSAVGYGSNQVSFICDGSALPNTLNFNDFLLSWIELALFRSIISCVNMDNTGREFTNAGDLFRKLIKTDLVTSDAKPHRIFKKFLAEKSDKQVFEITGKSDGVILNIHVHQEIARICFSGTVDEETTPGTWTSTTFVHEVPFDTTPEIGSFFPVERGDLPDGKYSAFVHYTDGEYHRIGIEI